MKKFLSVLSLNLVVSCGFFEKPTHEPSKPAAPAELAQLKSAYADHLAFLTTNSDPTSRWPSATDCDGTLWAGLALAAGASPDLSLAEYHSGEVHRRPLASGECYDGKTGATVSNDMIVGYLWGKWAAKDLDALKRLSTYGESRHWTMGEGDATMTVLRPNGIGLLGRMIFALSGGKDDQSFRLIPPVFLPVTADYEKHLLVEGIVLNGEVNESLRAQNLPGGQGLIDVNSHDLERLKELAASEVGDTLVQASYGVYTGDFQAALDGLLVGDTPIPSYVRGDQPVNFAAVHWLKSAKLILDRFPDAK